MQDEGYVEGKNIVVERRYVDGGVEQLQSAANEIASLKVDAIVSTCSDSTAAAKRATASSRIPVVMAFFSDPVGQYLIESYNRPGGNNTDLAS
jgi:putative ABC transport system substrate-binding protein